MLLSAITGSIVVFMHAAPFIRMCVSNHIKKDHISSRNQESSMGFCRKKTGEHN